MENRLADRRRTLLSAKISTGESLDDCVVQNLSIKGAEIQSLVALHVDKKVTLEIPRIGAIPSRVAWYLEKLMGLQFLEPLEEGSLSTLMAPNAGEGNGASVGSESLQVAGERAELEAGLLEVARGLSSADLGIAIKQMSALAERGD